MKRRPSDHRKYTDASMVIFVLAAFVLVPPSLQLWASADSPWYLPYLVWAALIALVALTQRLRDRDEL